MKERKSRNDIKKNLKWVKHTCNSSTLDLEAEGSQVESQPKLHKDFEDSLGYLRLCL